MKILFYLHHPSQFLLLRYTILKLRNSGHETIIIATQKDILINLIKESSLNFINILPKGRKNNRISIGYSLLKQDLRLFKICKKTRPDLMVGTSTEIAQIGKLLSIPSIFLCEDDIKVIPLVGKLAFPFAKHLLTPACCNVGKWRVKQITYNGYQKLAYLHPNIFMPEQEKVKFDLLNKPFFIIRITDLNAHHDFGIKGISDNLLQKLIEVLSKKGQVFISSEKQLPEKYNEYQLKIHISDFHHYLSFAEMLICSSQSMAVEASVLGTPSVRISSFAGKISVLEELENKYKLTFGIKPENEREIIDKIEELVNYPNLKDTFQIRRKIMLSEKIDVANFLFWFIESYPVSVKVMKENPDYQYKFK